MISTNGSDDKQFGAHFLENIMEWTVNHFSIGDLFTEDELKEYIKEDTCFEPEDLFEDHQLERWAEENGWVREG